MPKEYKYKIKFGECLTKCEVRKDTIYIASFACTEECSNFVSITREIEDGAYCKGIILCKGEEYAKTNIYKR